jgi:RNA polymerase sigma-70 factor (ECF subfamily)
MNSDLQNIIRACGRQERWAQEKLYKQFSGLLFAICLRYTKNRMDAQDVLQEVFVKVYTHVGTYQFDGSFEGWMRRIAVNTSITFYRKSVKKAIEKDLGDGAAEIEEVGMNVLGEFEMNDMLHCIEQLPLGYRTVFNLYVIEGYKHKEIAEMLNVDINTSKSQLSRAKVQLQKELEKLNLITKA